MSGALCPRGLLSEGDSAGDISGADVMLYYISNIVRYVDGFVDKFIVKVSNCQINYSVVSKRPVKSVIYSEIHSWHVQGLILAAKIRPESQIQDVKTSPK